MRPLLLALLLATPLPCLAVGPEVGPCVPCDLLFATTGGSDGELFTIDPETAALDLIGSVSSYSDIALTPDGQLFGLGNGGELHQLDPCSAAVTPLGFETRRPGATGTTQLDELLVSGSLLQAVDLVAGTATDLPSAGWCGFAAGDLALNPCDGLAWQVSRGPACPCAVDDAILETLDPVTGDIIEQVDCLPFPALFGLAFDSACNLWLTDARSEALIRYQPLTGDWVIVPTAPLGGVLGLASVPCDIAGTCDAGGPYEARCGAPACPDGEALVELDASASALPSASPLAYDWEISCAGSLVASASGRQAAICLPAGCGEVCEVELAVSNEEGRSLSCLTTVVLVDDSAPSLTGVPADAVADCDAVPAAASPGASDDCDMAPLIAFSESRIDGPCPGEYELVRSWSATDDCGNVSSAEQSIHVVDRTPPAIEEIAELVACLWPPNHRFVRIDAEVFAPVVREACSEPVSWRLAGCVSDEADDGLGDGRTVNDCRVSEGGRALLVRAERSGRGEGRNYSVFVVASDACGNESEPTLSGRIHVPHDRREHADCLAALPHRDEAGR